MMTATLNLTNVAETVESLEPLIGWWLKRVRWAGDWEDGMQEGRIGILTALKKFDPEKGAKFSTYAGLWIRQSIEKAMKRAPLAVEDLPEVATDADVVVDAAQGAELREALKGLTAAEREIIELRFFNNASLEEVGTKLGCHKFSASNKIDKILAKVRGFLAREN